MSRTITHNELEGGLTRFYSSVFIVMGIGLMITAGITYLISSSPGLMTNLFHLTETIVDGKTERSMSASGWWWTAAIIELILVWVIAGKGLSGSKGVVGNLLLFAFYCGLNGVTLAPAIYAYTSTSIAMVFMITAGMFGGCALWGVVTKRNLLPLSTFFLGSLIGLLLVMILHIIFPTPLMDVLISVVAVLLFAALTAFDMQKLREMYNESNGEVLGLVIYGALTLYLDFINLFLHMLRLFGIKKD